MKNKNWRAANLPSDVRGPKNGHWKGGVCRARPDGYVLIRAGVFPRTHRGARYRLEHRIVMERHLGRPLLRSEVVHHVNGITSDNRIENLELVISQSAHAKLHKFGLQGKRFADGERDGKGRFRRKKVIPSPRVDC